MEAESNKLREKRLMAGRKPKIMAALIQPPEEEWRAGRPLKSQASPRGFASFCVCGSAISVLQTCSDELRNI